MNRQKAAEFTTEAVSRLADEDLLSLPEGRLAMAVLGQVVDDVFRGSPGGRLYLVCRTERPGSWAWWCRWLQIDPDLAREKVLEYGARYQQHRREK